VNLVWAVVITLAVTAFSIGALLLVRRRAPDGGYFNDGDRAAGVFGVLATGYAVILGFVVFLAFTRYDEARAGGEAEALSLVQLFETSQLFAEEHRATLAGQLICYGRSVVHQEWPALESGDGPEVINPWGVRVFLTVQSIEPETASEQSAYDAFLDLTQTREEARRDRNHGAEGVTPASVWFALLFSAGLVFVYMLFFADSGERAIVQAVLIGSVTALVVMTLLTLRVLDGPYAPGIGALEPVAMERSLVLMDTASDAIGLDATPPCDDQGMPSGG
jgi:hypothetical protein